VCVDVSVDVSVSSISIDISIDIRVGIRVGGIRVGIGAFCAGIPLSAVAFIVTFDGNFVIGRTIDILIKYVGVVGNRTTDVRTTDVWTIGVWAIGVIGRKGRTVGFVVSGVVPTAGTHLNCYWFTCSWRVDADATLSHSRVHQLIHYTCFLLDIE